MKVAQYAIKHKVGNQKISKIVADTLEIKGKVRIARLKGREKNGQ